MTTDEVMDLYWEKEMGEETILEWLQKRQGMAAKETITDEHIEQCVSYMRILEKQIKMLEEGIRHFRLCLKINDAETIYQLRVKNEALQKQNDALQKQHGELLGEVSRLQKIVYDDIHADRLVLGEFNALCT